MWGKTRYACFLSVDFYFLGIHNEDFSVCNRDMVVPLCCSIVPHSRTWRGKRNRSDGEQPYEDRYGCTESKEGERRYVAREEAMRDRGELECREPEPRETKAGRSRARSIRETFRRRISGSSQPRISPEVHC